MADDVDRANDLAEAERVHALEQLLRIVPREPRTHCAECGEPIGAGRLVVLPLAQHCFECADVRELKKRHGR